jgi:hypothetical protein
MARGNSERIEKKSGRLTRREFARRAALGAAIAAATPREFVLPAAAASNPAPTVAGEAEEPKLSPEARAEAEEKISAIFRKYGARLSEEQKADVRRMVLEGQAPLEQLRAFPLENSDEPATVLHPARRPAASAAIRPARKAPASKTTAQKKGV